MTADSEKPTLEERRESDRECKKNVRMGSKAEKDSIGQNQEELD